MRSEIVCADSFDWLRVAPDNSIDLIVSSPPYGIGKSYETRNGIEEYTQWTDTFLSILTPKVKNAGAIVYQIGMYISESDGEVIPLDYVVFPLFKKYGWILRNRIVWTFAHGLHCKKRLSGRHEVLLWFSKSSSYTFNLDDIRVPSQEPGKRAYKGPNIGKLSGHPLGKNPGDVWEILAREWDLAVWNLPCVKNNHCEKTGHPCQFPVELAERCVLAFSNPGDVIVDPFCGVATSVLAAELHERVGIGIEKLDEYVAIGNKRLAELRAGTLRIRELGAPIQEASLNTKTRKYPEEWVPTLTEFLGRPRFADPVFHRSLIFPNI